MSSSSSEHFWKPKPLSDEEQKKKRHMEKNRQKARTAAAGLNFNDLMNLAQNQSTVAESDESSDSNSACSGKTRALRYIWCNHVSTVGLRAVKVLRDITLVRHRLIIHLSI